MADLFVFADPLKRSDPRVPLFFEKAERSLQEQIVYVEARWKWIGPIQDRVERTNKWLPIPANDDVPEVFGNGTNGKRQVIVGLLNQAPQRHGEGGLSRYHIGVGDKSELPDRLTEALQLVAPAVDAHFGCVDSRVCRRQLFQTPQDVAMRSRSAADLLREKGLRVPAHLRNAKPAAPDPAEKVYGLTKKRIVALTRSGSGVEIGHWLSWVNYWSQEVADSLGFPDRSKDQILDGLYKRVSQRGWLVKLTNDPLDLDIPDHLARVQWAFDRFASAKTAEAT